MEPTLSACLIETVAVRASRHVAFVVSAGEPSRTAVRPLTVVCAVQKYHKNIIRGLCPSTTSNLPSSRILLGGWLRVYSRTFVPRTLPHSRDFKRPSEKGKPRARAPQNPSRAVAHRFFVSCHRPMRNRSSHPSTARAVRRGESGVCQCL